MSDPQSPKSKVPRPRSSPKGQWGGRRPGAGAPKGNLNALKHGKFSKDNARLLRLLVEIPEARDLLLIIARRNKLLRTRAELQTARLMLAFLQAPESAREHIAALAAQIESIEARTIKKKAPTRKRKNTKR